MNKAWLIGLVMVGLMVNGQAKLVTNLVEVSDTPQETVSKWAGMGKELGSAFKGAAEGFITTADGAAEVTIKRVNEFANTRVGKFTMILVAWKFMGTEMLRFCVSSVAVVSLWFVSIWIYRRVTIPRRVVKKIDRVNKTKEYTVIDPPCVGENASGAGLLLFVVLVIVTAFGGCNAIGG